MSLNKHDQRKDFRSVIIVSILSILLLTTGCETVALMGGAQKTFQGHDSLVLKTARPDIMNVVAEVGRANGYDVSSFDEETRTITLSGGGSLLAAALVGKVSGVGLTLSSNEACTKLDIIYVASGNFGTGSQDNAVAVVNDFKAKLLSRLEH